MRATGSSWSAALPAWSRQGCSMTPLATGAAPGISHPQQHRMPRKLSREDALGQPELRHGHAEMRTDTLRMPQSLLNLQKHHQELVACHRSRCHPPVAVTQKRHTHCTVIAPPELSVGLILSLLLIEWGWRTCQAQVHGVRVRAVWGGRRSVRGAGDHDSSWPRTCLEPHRHVASGGLCAIDTAAEERV